MARRKEAHGGGHGWFVTFADLMGLLVSLRHAGRVLQSRREEGALNFRCGGDQSRGQAATAFLVRTRKTSRGSARSR